MTNKYDITRARGGKDDGAVEKGVAKNLDELKRGMRVEITLDRESPWSGEDSVTIQSTKVIFHTRNDHTYSPVAVKATVRGLHKYGFRGIFDISVKGNKVTIKPDVSLAKTSSVSKKTTESEEFSQNDNQEKQHLPDEIQKVLYPKRLLSVDSIVERLTLVPRSPGIYGWYFNRCSEIIPEAFCSDCHQYQGKTLLYIGIAPDEPKRGKKPSGSTLNSRIVGNHCNGDAECSTLRYSLGCLLASQLSIQLRLQGRSKRFAKENTTAGETRLNKWMSDNAFVTFVEIQNPWEIEKKVLGKPEVLSLPLNIKGNKNHPFCARLKKIRKDALAQARKMSSI